MTSFLSDKNISRLQYELRQLFPENKWVAIASSVRDSARVWFYQHTDTLQLIYQRDGLNGLNKKFISDMVASAEYFDNTNVPAYQQDQLFDTDISDPNIQADQPMPYTTGIENPLFTFTTFSKGWDASGTPETKYIYSQKPNYGEKNALSHTLQGPGNRRGPIKHYSDVSSNPQLSDALLQTKNNEQYNITDKISYQGFDSQQKSSSQCKDCNRVPMPYVRPSQQTMPTHKDDSNLIRQIQKMFVKPFKNAFTSREDAAADIQSNNYYGQQLSKNIYNTDKSKMFPNAFGGYTLGKMVDSYDSENGKFIPYPNNTTTNVMKTINQLQFGDVPIATEMSNDELAVLGHQLYRQKDRPKRQRPPQVDENGIPRREYFDLFDDYPTNQVRAKFHLDQIYNTPESRINTIMDPVMGRTAMWKSQERSVLDIPCSSMSGVQQKAGMGRTYPDGYADSYSTPGCRLTNSEPNRTAYPTRDFIPPRYTTNYSRI